MTMNKSEKALVEHLRTELAFRWPVEADPRPQDVPTHPNETQGWSFNAYNRQITQEWSGASRHGHFYDGRKIGASQGGVRLYATRREALLALRWELCRLASRQLFAIDQLIEREDMAA